MSDSVLNPYTTDSGVKRYTLEDIAKMNVALEAMKGNVKAAAELLGMPASTLTDQIRNRPEMKARWTASNELVSDGKVNSDSEEVAITQGPPKEMALSPAEKKAAMLAVHERKMKRSLAQLGFKSQEIEMITSVEQFAGEHFKQTLSILHGSMVKMGMRLMLQAERIEEKYLTDDSLGAKERDFWWKAYFEIIEKLRLMNSEANKAALTRAMIDLKRDGNTPTKPGFSVPQVAIQINGGKTNVSAGKTGEPDAAS